MLDEHPLCSLCLGDDTEVPPFGTVKDAQDLIRPCTTCSLVTHKKCLLDWFNSLPSKDIYVMDTSNIQDVDSIRNNINNNNENEVSFENLINISSNMFNQLVSNIGAGTVSLSRPLHSDANASDKTMKFLLVDCPQCKQHIVFCMKRNTLLFLYKTLRESTTSYIQYGLTSIGIGSAIAGVISMGYVGLTSCGLKMMDCIIPESLLVQILSKKSTSLQMPGTLSRLIFGNVKNYAVDNLEKALVKGLIDPLKFSRIPILPIILYRMRSSSWLSCLFSYQKDSILYSWGTELMIAGYFSSLGNHKLFRTVSFNLKMLIKIILSNPRDLSSASLSMKKIDFWDINNMVSMLVPLRWLYDLIFRLTINRLYFNQAMNVRPREVSNSLNSNEVDYIEALSSEVVSEEIKFNRIKANIDELVDREFEKKPNIPLVSIIHKYIRKKMIFQKQSIGNNSFYFSKLKFTLWLHQTMACLKNDYSTTFLSHSVTIRAITTTLWPFLGSKVGNIIFNLLMKDSNILKDIPQDKVLLLANIIGLVVVTFLKDLSNTFISSKKVKELSQMSVICVDPQIPENENDTHQQENNELNFPGGFEH